MADIVETFKALRDQIDKQIKTKHPEMTDEDIVLTGLVMIGLQILESLVTDINRAATALETIAAQERILP
jgi:adenylosuccinate lyase